MSLDTTVSILEMMKLRFKFVLLMTGFSAVCFRADAAGSDSVYLSLAKDVRVTNLNQVLLTTNIFGGQTALLCADGDFQPLGASLVNAFITVDGKKVSNDTVINWNGSLKPVAHSFRAISAVRLAPGPHVIALVANGSRAFIVGANANLSIMTEPAGKIESAILHDDSPVIAVNTPSVRNGIDPLRFISIGDATVDAKAGEPVVLLGAGRSFYAGVGRKDNGDAMWGFWIDGAEATANEATYADNDMFEGAELQAPMFVQGFFEFSEGRHTVTMGASAEPWPADIGMDGVRYKVGAGSRLIALHGGIVVAGHSVAIDAERDFVQYNRFPYQCVSSSKGWKGCPATNQDIQVSSGTITVPEEHNGIIFISAMTRLQGDRHDQGGRFEMWLMVDGVRQGSTGVQELSSPSSVSTRTVAASFMTTGDSALSPGRHVVQLYIRATGHFIHLAITRNMPILWFD